MKIVQIIPSLHMGGGEKFAINLSNSLSNDKTINVTLCVISKIEDEMLLKKLISNNINIICLNKNKGFDLRIFYKLNKLIKEINPDIVHTHLRSIVYSFLPIVFSKVKFIHTIHTLAEKEARSYIKKMLYSLYFNHCGVVPIAISTIVQKSITDLFGNKHNRLIENGVPNLEITNKFQFVKDEVSKYKFSDQTKVLISVGRVTEVKNQLLLINLMKIYEKENKDIILLILGSLENEKNYANNCIEKAKNLKNIYFLGEKSNVSDYIYLSDAVCLSSKYEGHPLVVLESLSLGKTILSTKVGGIPDILNSNNSYLSNNMTINSYKKIVDNYLLNGNRDKINIIEEFDNKYSIDICKNKYLHVYNLLII